MAVSSLDWRTLGFKKKSIFLTGYFHTLLSRGVEQNCISEVWEAPFLYKVNFESELVAVS